ncbi:CPBP family intramembrane glutamic endopeptidase [Halalkalicoccus jeotgali]|uniref:Abortive infection protein n=1 Tax=Halalkalicoccus jeotgali (strain DSM 18796 / CECT 7217 / JCM 14584 / KCTC 4019 / B3) TaxID=795797 RepID=D8J8F0_HALJB|nr:CPBP family intramembrane glutamic endopeptidase [Halalkalicoccus jeotgali]ADJ16196.1 Abortive infection protein [Halalkalicoccus jeotgali B3]ELY37624.1 abortive infection protein [Halalkalicoccus jeotgali B3]
MSIPGRLSWVHQSLLVGGVVLLVWVNWSTTTLTGRVVRDTLLYLLVPLGLGLVHGRNVGWRVDRRAIRDTLVLSAFVLPFYLVGSTLPSVREFYPLWETTPALGAFVPHAIQLFVLALATETYFRGLLCVGVRDLGAKCVFISPVVYALLHVHKPPIELALSGPTDVLFGAVDYHADSILPSTVAHGGGLVLLDWLVLHEPLVSPEAVLRWLAWLPLPL